MAHSSAHKPLVAVVGATGQQGGGVVLALTRSGKFRVRALTRDPSSPAATEVAALPNTTAVKADLNDVNSVYTALQGVDAFFLATDFFVAAKANPELEIQQGKNGVDAAKRAGVKHLVFSTLEDPRKDVAPGKFPEVYPGRIVPHFETKAEIQEYIVQQALPATFLLTSIFYENFINYPFLSMPPRLYQFDNTQVATLPSHSVTDIGESAAVVFADPAQYIGQTVPVVADFFTMRQACKTIRDTTAINLFYMLVSDEQYWHLPFPDNLAKDMGNMWRYYREYGDAVRGRRDPVKAVYQGRKLEDWCYRKQGALKYKKNLNPVMSLITLMLLGWFWYQDRVLRRIWQMISKGRHDAKTTTSSSTPSTPPSSTPSTAPSTPSSTSNQHQPTT